MIDVCVGAYGMTASRTGASTERSGAVVGVRGRLFEMGHVVVLAVYTEHLLRALERGERTPRLGVTFVVR